MISSVASYLIHLVSTDHYWGFLTKVTEEYGAVD